MLFVDGPGLVSVFTSKAQVREYVEAARLNGTVLLTQRERLQTLVRLREGAGVTVYTGPTGAPFWSLASVETKVRVFPDGTDYTARTSDETFWSYLAAGATDSVARGLARRSKPPRATAKDAPAWERGAALRRGLAKAAATAAPALIAAGLHVDIVHERSAQGALLDALDPRELTAMDWEWDPDEGNAPLGIALSTPDRNIYLPVRAGDYAPQGADHGAFLRERVAAVLDRKSRTVWHSAASDLGAQYPGDPLDLVDGVNARMDDTLVMAYLVGEPDLRLKSLTRTLLSRDPVDYPGKKCLLCRGSGTWNNAECEDCGGTGHHSLANAPLAMVARYAAAGDTRNTLDLYHELRPELESKDQWEVYRRIERPIIPMVASMEKYGSPLDMAAVQAHRDDFFAKEEAIRKQVKRKTGFDLSDDDETKAYIASVLGYNPGTLDQRVLAKHEGAWMDDLLSYRRNRTRRRNFLDNMLRRWEALGSPELHYAYPHFNQAGSAIEGDPRSFTRAPRSGRFSSSKPNFQNQPRDIRAAFVPPPGVVYWSLDYSGLELHIAASVSRDRAMLSKLREVCPAPVDGECPHRPKHGDLHDAFLYRIIELTGVDVGRPTAKAANFEQLYGGGPEKLVQILQKERVFITLDTAKITVQAHEDTFPEYHAYADRVVARARSNGGYAETLFGRRRYEPDLLWGDPERQSWAGRALVNTTIQGTAADVVKIAMRRAVPVLRKYGAHCSIQVHDELTGWVSPEAAPDFLAEMKKVMAGVRIPGLRLKAEGAYGPSWGEAH